MTDFIQFCEQFSSLDDDALSELSQAAATKKYKKGQHLLNKNRTCKHLFYIHKGLVKIFFMDGEKEFVMRFFAENVMFSVFESYLTQTPSKFMLIALEDTTVTLIAHEAMEDLCRKHHSIETFFRKLLSIACVKMTKRISQMLEGDAQKRYDLFVQENNSLLQRISFGDIAKYVGITQQSLSRIRARK
jgi:signal-transduction protein with cAMP-binding, CBS, and nucleotidyltransferase domain